MVAPAPQSPPLTQAQPKVAQVVGQICKRLIDSGRDSRKHFLKTGREIMRYGYAPDYDFEYQKINPNAFFRAKVALTAEAFSVIGPYLFPQVPTRVLEPRKTVDENALRRMEIVSGLVNYTPKETGLRDDCRRAIVEAIGYGRGVMWVGRDEKTGLVYSMYDSVRNLITDPNARVKRERKWVGRRRCRPRFEVIAEIPSARATIEKIKASEQRPTDLDGRYDWEAKDTSTDCITYYELYALTGIHNFKGGTELVKLLTPQATTDDQVKASSVEMDNSPLKYCVSEDGTLLYVTEWEVPYHIKNEFPCEELDLLDNPDSDWPVSPLAAGSGYQRAINWLVTMMMGKYRFTARTFGALSRAGGMSQKDKDKVLIGGDIEMLEITTNGSETKSLKDYISEFQFSQDYLVHGMKFLEMLEDKFQKATGLYEILYAGDTSRQMRSAQEAQLKERTSKTRIDDHKDRVAEWQARLSRKEALAWRFLADRNDVADILGEQAGADWGFLVKPENMDVQKWIQENIQAGMPPDQAIEQAQQQMSQAVDINAWSKEIDYSIEVGSMRRRDVDTKIDALKEMMNQAVPTQLQSVDPAERALAYFAMADYYDVVGVDREIVEMYKQKGAQLKQMGDMQAQMLMQQTQMQMMMGPQQPPIAGPGAQPQRAAQ